MSVFEFEPVVVVSASLSRALVADSPAIPWYCYSLLSAWANDLFFYLINLPFSLNLSCVFSRCENTIYTLNVDRAVEKEELALNVEISSEEFLMGGTFLTPVCW